MYVLIQSVNWTQTKVAFHLYLSTWFSGLSIYTLPTCRIKYGSSPGQPLENKPHSSASSSSVEKLPDASLLLNSPFVSSNLVSASDHSSRVAAALAENASRKRDSNGMASSTVRNKAPRGNLPHSKSVPETTSGLLVPPQISGRLVVMC